MAVVGYPAQGASGGNTDDNTSGIISVSGTYSFSGGTLQDGQLWIVTLTGSGARSQAMRLVMFADNGSGVPSTTLAAVTNEIIVSDTSNNSLPQTYYQAFPSFSSFGGAPDLALGNYWVGAWFGTVTGTTTLEVASETVVNLPPHDSYFQTATYSSTSNPTLGAWTDTGSVGQYSLYFDYYVDSIIPGPKTYSKFPKWLLASHPAQARR
jgi:hypothetical protein